MLTNQYAQQDWQNLSNMIANESTRGTEFQAFGGSNQTTPQFFHTRQMVVLWIILQEFLKWISVS